MVCITVEASSGAAHTGSISQSGTVLAGSAHQVLLAYYAVFGALLADACACIQNILLRADTAEILIATLLTAEGAQDAEIEIRIIIVGFILASLAVARLHEYAQHNYQNATSSPS